jgi:CheY-like chemotaxis protein
VEKNYKRADNIDELIHSVKLPYLAWKVLFLIGEQMETKKISEILEESEKDVADALSLLENEKLIITEAVEEAAQAEPVAEEKPEAPEEIKTEEEPPAISEEITETAEETVLEEDEAAELITDIEDESPDVSEADLLSSEAEEPAAEEKKEEAPEIKIDGEEESLLEEAEPEKTEEEAPQVEQEVKEEEDETIDLGIDFSAQEEEKPAAPPVEEEKPQPKSGQTTILVIDDSIVIRKMVEIALEDANFHIESAVNGKSGLEMVDKVDPKLVIVDLMLPDINGIDILKTIKASKGVPVIMLSGKDTPQMIEKAKAEGADEFLPKPFKDEELVEKINTLLQ